MGDEQKCSKKKKKNAFHYQKKGVKKNAWWGNSFRLLLPSFLNFFFPIQNSRKVRGNKIKKKP